MDGTEIGIAQIWDFKDFVNSLNVEQALFQVAKCHSKCLSQTSSSRAGLDVLVEMYRSIYRDPNSTILIGVEGTRVLGFLAFTKAYRQTEKMTIQVLPKWMLLKLSLFNLLSPSHSLARLAWNAMIPDENCGYIMTLGILPECRKYGVRGTDLLRYAESILQSLRITNMMVDTEEKNEKALRFYEKNGYQTVREKFGQILMKKELIS